MTFLLLGLAVLAAWLPAWRGPRGFTVSPWAVLLAAAVAAGLVQGYLRWPAVAGLGLLSAWAAVAVHPRVPPAAARTFMWLAVLLAVALALHLWPGFHNPKYLVAVQTSPEAAPFSRTASFDKAAAGLLLLACFVPRLTGWAEARAAWRPTLAVAAATCVLVLGAGWAGGYVRPDLKWPPFAPEFLATNLLFTCVAEETIFRGLLQERLHRALQGRRGAFWLPVLLSCALFGVAHTGGGALLMLLAALPGAGYALAYALTRRVESAVLVHFAVNAVHFLAFTYPHVPLPAVR